MLIAIDCEGPLTRNDNALELSRHFIPAGERLFTQLSRYDDIMAFMLKQPGYQSGNTLKLICPFFKAFGVKNQDIIDFSLDHILIMPGAEIFIKWMDKKGNSVIISTSYKQYIYALCDAIGFSRENTFSTDLDIDCLIPPEEECQRVKEMAYKIISLSSLDWDADVTSLDALSKEMKKTFNTINKFLAEELEGMKIGRYLDCVKPLGGLEKAKAVQKSCEITGEHISSVIYIGDSITDVDAFRMVREGGGMTIAFNGNRYAIYEAEIACLAHHSGILAVVCQLFEEKGRDGVLEAIENWDIESPYIRALLSNSSIEDNLLDKEKEYPSSFVLLNDKNRNDVIKRSENLRSRIRGEEIGRLG